MKSYYRAAAGFDPVEMHNMYNMSFMESLQFKNYHFHITNTPRQTNCHNCFLKLVVWLLKIFQVSETLLQHLVDQPPPADLLLAPGLSRPLSRSLSRGLSRPFSRSPLSRTTALNLSSSLLPSSFSRLTRWRYWGLDSISLASRAARASL